MFDYAGAIHFHSAYSYDARIPLPKILEDANRAGLHFAVLADHFRLDAQQEGFNRYHGQTLLIVGQEISPRYNHYLAFDVPKPLVAWKTEANAQRVIDEVSQLGGFGFIAHPDHPGAPLIGSRAYPWIMWDVHGFSGMGIWDLMSDWSSALGSYFSALKAWISPARALRGPFSKTLSRWDALTQRMHCVAIGEIDNHGNRRTFLGFKRRIFPFLFAFQTIRTHVLLEAPLTQDAPGDSRRILQALRQGQSYVSLDYWADATGFSFSIYDENKRAWPGGEFIRNGPALLEAKLTSPGRLRIIRDGRPIKEERKRSAMQWDMDMPGVYRIEADLHAAGQWRPWIFSNPIWVK